MKKLTVCLLVVILALAFTACGGKADGDAAAKAPSDADKAASAPETADQSEDGVEPEDGFETVDESTPFGQYRSVEELLKILSGEAEDDSLQTPYYEVPEPVPAQEGADASEGYTGKENTTTFTDDPWEETGVEFAVLEGTEGGEASGQTGDWSSYTEFTSGLPAPAGTAPQITLEEGVFTAIVMLGNDNEYDEYLETVKKSGFTEGADEEDLSAMGMKLFTASHQDGRVITLTVSDKTLIVVIEN